MSSSMFRKKSRANVRHHRAQWKAKLSAPRLAPCPDAGCGELKPPHLACPACGTYNGRQILRGRRDRQA